MILGIVMCFMALYCLAQTFTSTKSTAGHRLGHGFMTVVFVMVAVQFFKGA